MSQGELQISSGNIPQLIKPDPLAELVKKSEARVAAEYEDRKYKALTELFNRLLCGLFPNFTNNEMEELKNDPAAISQLKPGIIGRINKEIRIIHGYLFSMIASLPLMIARAGVVSDALCAMLSASAVIALCGSFLISFRASPDEMRSYKELKKHLLQDPDNIHKLLLPPAK